jgi:aerobic carbon-monoxide dehydrogenase medium subunit
MIPPPFEYLRPSTVPEAISLLEQHGEDAKILSGGQSLIPMMKLRLARPAWLIDINAIPGLDYIREQDGFLRIGGLVREFQIEASDLIRRKYPMLHDTASVIADPQVRSLATMGGNLAHGDPANDHPAAMLALDAEVAATGPKGSRTIKVEDFFVSFFTTALEPTEILTEIRVPIAGGRSGGAYFKLERKVGDFATAAAAAQVTLDDRGALSKVGIGLTNAGPVPIKAKRAEDFLRGKPPAAENIAQAAQLASDDAQPSSDLRGPAEYKKGLVKELTKRALNRAIERAGGAR